MVKYLTRLDVEKLFAKADLDAPREFEKNATHPTTQRTYCYS